MTEAQAPTSFDCLWCGRPHTPRRADDIEAYARLCSDCVGRAGENEFLRFRLRRALAERAGGHPPPVAAGPRAPARAATPDLDAEMRAYYAARAPE